MEYETLVKTYQKLNQREHVLKVPWRYVGSVKPVTEPQHVFDDNSQRIVRRIITYVPGLYKIFDEILVNAADNAQRDPKGQTMIKVWINSETGEIKVWNNGQGIPVQIHPKHKVYVPELIFGFMNSGSNFSEETSKVTGGRHGEGAKLVIILSKRATVETSHAASGKRFEQTFTANMTERTKPRIRKALKNDYTCITFQPDFQRFGVKGLDADTLALFKKRVYDLAGCNSRLRIYFNDTLIRVSNFKQYATLYYVKGEEPKPMPYHSVVDEAGLRRWEVIVVPSSGVELEHVSFANSIHTSRGGRHVQHVLYGIIKHLHAKAKAKFKNLDVRPTHVRNRIRVFINALIDNPEFDSQTKETLQSLVKEFGSTFSPGDKFLEKVMRTGILDSIGLAARKKAQKALSKASGRKRSRLTGIAKLEDANHAGGRYAHTCTLILTEGDSAKALAMAGLHAVPNGKDKYGVFPLRGKLLNVRDASAAQLLKNAEIQAIIKILGMRIGHTHTDTKTLRYGHVMIMTDQDVDGFHIKALVLNFFEKLWPSLLQVPGFVTEFITPLVRCRRRNEVKDFYNQPSFERWYKVVSKANSDATGAGEQTAGRGKQWHIKYYKGLGTSDNQEAKEYFGALQQHKKTFVMPDQAKTAEYISLAFSKGRADDRKTWIQAYDPSDTRAVSLTQSTINLEDFIDHDLRQFSIADCDRSLPSVMDGLKTSQRKILYACLKRNLKSELKVAQLSGYVTEHSAYHHGEASVQQTITGMAQTFTFANNLNLLKPCGQYGTREMGGKDAASARYISTHLTPIVPTLFNPLDAGLLRYKTEDNMQVEPDYYLPVIPFVLVNGVGGIGTGFSATFPASNPSDVSANVRRALRDQSLQPMVPWYRGFRGRIVQDTKETFRYHVHGVWERTKTGVIVRELPYRMWTTKYTQFLEKAMVNATNKGLNIEDYRKLGGTRSENVIALAIDSKQLVDEPDDNTVSKLLNLHNSILTSNMNAFDAQGRIRRFDTACDIIRYYVPFRLKAYGDRKTLLLKALDDAMVRIRNVWRFLGEICKGTFQFARRTKAAMETELAQKKYAKLPAYDYLLNKPFYSASEEKLKALEAQLKAKQAERDALATRTPTQLWLSDLDAFDSAWQQHCVALEKAEAHMPSTMKKIAVVRKRKRKRTSKSVPAAKRRKQK